jgi:hypothetical protein
MKTKQEILLLLSAGEISLIEATDDLGYQDAGYTLHALRDAGLMPFSLDDTTIKRQADDALDSLRAALKKKTAEG